VCGEKYKFTIVLNHGKPFGNLRNKEMITQNCQTWHMFAAAVAGAEGVTCARPAARNPRALRKWHIRHPKT
jgi:hypothetical protein